jgi:peptide-methionine (S)-S-oxide reductase
MSIDQQSRLQYEDERRQVHQIGMGGSCHWCTEAIFLSLKGVLAVKQGWIASGSDCGSWSEAVIVEFDETRISLSVLVAVHLATHSCTAEHSMRVKYRSAIYCFSDNQVTEVSGLLAQLQSGYAHPIITRVIPFGDFRLNTDQYLNYYYKDPSKPFCNNVINPKLQILLSEFEEFADREKLTSAGLNKDL